MRLGTRSGQWALCLAAATMALSLAGCGKYGKPQRSTEPAAASEPGTAAAGGAAATGTTTGAEGSGAATQPALRDETDPRLEGNRR